MLNKEVLLKAAGRFGTCCVYILVAEVISVGLMSASDAIKEVIKKKKSSTIKDEA